MVSDYAMGIWQITRETLRAAHQLYLHDKRDYSQLPARLRPPRQLDLNNVNDAVLTAYAGLLLRDLLDHFGGDVEKAIGAYNGGVRTPNPDYASGVKNVADYARRIRSEEHTSELQSRLHLVCRLLLEKKKTTKLSKRHRLIQPAALSRQPRSPPLL